MSKGNTVRRSPAAAPSRRKRSAADKRRRSRDRWGEFDAITDEEIEAAVASDPDAPPFLPPDWIKKATLIRPTRKEAISIRLDEDVLEYFRREERWQTRINAILRAVMEHEKA